MSKSQDFQTWSFAIQQQMELALGAVLPAAHQLPQRLHEAMRYAVLGGGKRMRPLLVYASGQIFGADEHALDAPAMTMVRDTSLALKLPTAAALAMMGHSPALLQYVILPVAASTLQSLR